MDTRIASGAPSRTAAAARHAPRPRPAHQRVPSAGADATPTGVTRMRVSFSQVPPDLERRLVEIGFSVDRAAQDEAVLRLPPGPDSESEAVSRLVAAGLKVRAFSPVKDTLEAAYLREARGPGQEWGA